MGAKRGDFFFEGADFFIDEELHSFLLWTDAVYRGMG